jgi:hypothetical protein
MIAERNASIAPIIASAVAAITVSMIKVSTRPVVRTRS